VTYNLHAAWQAQCPPLFSSMSQASFSQQWMVLTIYTFPS
jgi:hypothetical protein